jgi:inorganic triphosphatase YgiF
VIEFEIKLTASKKVMERIETFNRFLDWKIENIGSRHLISHYFDTECFSLLYNNLAYRLREEDGKRLVYLKANGILKNCIYVREETEVKLKDGKDVTRSCFLKKYFPNVLCATRGEPLQEVLIIDNERHILMLNKKSSQIELALDYLYFVRGKKRIPYNEIELELKKGNEEDLVECSSLIQTSCGLKTAGASKYELGLRSFNLIPIP